MTIPLQFASLYDGQEVRSDCLLDLGTDFLVGGMDRVTNEGRIQEQKKHLELEHAIQNYPP